MAYSLDGTDLGIVHYERVTKQSSVDVINPVMEDSDQAEAVQMFGPVKMIEIEGTKVSTTLSDLQTFVNFLKGLDTGEQSAHTYVSDLNGTITVAVQDVNWEWEGGSPFIVRYSIRMVEVSEII